MNNLIAAAEQFKSSSKVIDIREYGNGNINKTFLVTLDAKTENHFILQRINAQVFSRPELIMSNMRIFTEHARKRLQSITSVKGRRWEVPRVLLAQDTRDHWRDSDKSFWRAISFIESSQSFDTLKNIEHAKEAGYALGMFHNLISDLSPDKLADTLEGFHITPHYLRHYNDVLSGNSARKSPEINYCMKFIRERSTWAHVLEDAKAQGKLNLRLIHGDPKVNNIMMDTATGQAISIVDLDTVKPGLVHYDIGDCLRSGCNPAGEETEQTESVKFETDFCKAILQGYLSKASEFLNNNDYDYLYDSIRLIAFELGLRFFTDFLEGNIYFKTTHAEHNLVRALVQFRLTESIESQAAAIRSIIRDLR